jgi:hypothetical protein
MIGFVANICGNTADSKALPVLQNANQFMVSKVSLAIAL